MKRYGSKRTHDRRAALLALMNKREREELPNTPRALAFMSGCSSRRVREDLLALEAYGHVFRYARQWFAYNDDVGVE